MNSEYQDITLSGEHDYSTYHLDEVKRMLGYTGKGFRSVLKWCRLHKVPVLGKGKQRRILKVDWIKINRAQYIEAIKVANPKNWREILKQLGVDWNGISHKSKANYQAKGKLTKEFFKDWENE